MSQKKTKINQQPTKTAEAASFPEEASSDGLVSLKLRLSAEERAKLEALAKADGRSLNNYIVHRIIRCNTPQVFNETANHNEEAEKKCRVQYTQDQKQG